MEKSKEKPLPEEKKQTLPVNRRKMLKIMAATLGVQAPLFLPEKWTKPLFDAIIVPAHAATSSPETPDPPVINSCVISARDKSGYATGVYSCLLEYEDPACEFDIHYTRLQYTVSWDGSLSFASGATIDTLPGPLPAGYYPCAGSIGFIFNTLESSPPGSFHAVDNAADTIGLQLMDADGNRLSNVFNASFSTTPTPLVINNCVISVGNEQSYSFPVNESAFATGIYSCLLEYEDPDCALDIHYTKLQYNVSWDGSLSFESGSKISDIAYTVSNTSCGGSIGFNFSTFYSTSNPYGDRDLHLVNNAADTLELQLVDADGVRLSNVLNTSFGVSVDPRDTPFPPSVKRIGARAFSVGDNSYRLQILISDPSNSSDFPNYHYTRLAYRTDWGGKLNFESGTRLENIPGCYVTMNGTNEWQINIDYFAYEGDGVTPHNYNMCVSERLIGDLVVYDTETEVYVGDLGGANSTSPGPSTW